MSEKEYKDMTIDELVEEFVDEYKNFVSKLYYGAENFDINDIDDNLKLEKCSKSSDWKNVRHINFKKRITWKKVDDIYIAEYNGHIAQDTELIKAIEKAVRGGEREWN